MQKMKTVLKFLKVVLIQRRPLSRPAYVKGGEKKIEQQSSPCFLHISRLWKRGMQPSFTGKGLADAQQASGKDYRPGKPLWLLVESGRPKYLLGSNY